ncbi:LON peptidase substrate-binding domain-containing protein [Dokdonella sp.]|uniref:LON peptidase substrate-binding domain-containing protein n=1 Tax=Dokdonella sp. TaxID=2291710 RepID=UPI0035270372
MSTESLPLFPLSSVLYPGGHLSLRIFEPRYLDLVRDCTRNDSGFGVCLILDGEEAGDPSVPAAIGTLARITDFHTLPDGLLGIHAQGSKRFTVLGTHLRDNGLIQGDVRFLVGEEHVSMPPDCGLLATILERVHEQVGGEYSRFDRTLYDDAAWVGFRLAEVLPLEAPERQLLLQINDPIERLHQLMHHLPRFQRD